MTVAVWIVLGLVAWVVVPMPFAVLIGRFLRGATVPADVPLAVPLR